MKGSENNSRSGFDKAWQDRLKDAEAAPSPSAWEGIDQFLGQQELLKYKFYLKVYRGIAAAAVLLAVGVSLYAYLKLPEQTVKGQPDRMQQPFHVHAINPYRLGAVPTDQPIILHYLHLSQGVKKGALSAKIPSSNISPSANLTYVFPDAGTEGQGTVYSYNKASPIAGTNGRQLTDDRAGTTENEQVMGSNVGKQVRGTEFQPTESLAENLNAGDANKGAFPTREGNANVNNRTATTNRAKANGEQLQEQSTNSAVLTTEGKFAADKRKRTAQKGTDDGSGIATDFTVDDSPTAGSLLPMQALAIKKKMAKPLAQTAAWKKAKPVSPINRPVRLAIEKKTKADQRSLYANLNLNSEMFNPNFRATGSLPMPVAVMTGIDPSINQQMGVQNTPEASVTYGLNLGMKLNSRWLLEGGVAYANYGTTTQTNVSLADVNRESPVPLTIQGRPTPQRNNSSMLTFGQRYDLVNSFEFASVPLRAGYVIPLHDFNFIFKAGVTTEFFISNEISEPNSVLSTVRHTPGEQSPFNRVFFNGTLGNEINYQLNSNYSFSLEANYRVALNSFTKQEEAFESHPTAYGIGMVVRYHFTGN